MRERTDEQLRQMTTQGLYAHFLALRMAGVVSAYRDRVFCELWRRWGYDEKELPKKEHHGIATD